MLPVERRRRLQRRRNPDRRSTSSRPSSSWLAPLACGDRRPEARVASPRSRTAARHRASPTPRSPDGARAGAAPIAVAGLDRRDPQAPGAADRVDPHDVVGFGRGETAQHLEATERRAATCASRSRRVLSSLPLAAASRSAAAASAPAELAVSTDVDRALPLLDRRRRAPCPRRSAPSDDALVDTGATEHAREAAQGVGRDLARERVGRVLGERSAPRR